MSTATAAVLRMIAQDMANDAKEFEGKPFTGATVAEYLGNIGAAVAALAEIVAEQLPPEEEPERDPVPYLDYLPELPPKPKRTIFTHCNWVGGCDKPLSEEDGSLLCAFHRAGDGWVA